MKPILVILICLGLVGCATVGNVDKLTKSNYEKSKDQKAVVIYEVNWGRKWGCAGYENAQLISLTFSRIDQETKALGAETIVLKTPSILFVDNIFLPYEIIVEPGEYALSGFNIKVAKSVREIWHTIADSKNLFENGKPLGGTFKANPGEIVYIGGFGLDCEYEPIPWRYYIEKEDFGRFSANLKKQYKFIADKEIIYRLFQTDNFGR